MALNAEGQAIEYTTDGYIRSMLESNAIDVQSTGFLENVYAIEELKVAGRKHTLLKAIISNGSKRLILMIWDEVLQAKFAPVLTLGQILHIDGGLGRKMKLENYLRVLDCQPYAIIINNSTIVTLLGTHVYRQ